VRISFTVWAIPIAQPRVNPGRPALKKDGTVVCYKDSGAPVILKANVPKEHPVHQFRHEVSVAGKAAMDGRELLHDCPLGFTIRMFVPRPKWCNATIGRGKKKRPKYGTGPIRCWKKPDLDNLIKSTKDSLEGVIWYNDSQIAAYGPCGKWYHEADGRPRVEVEVWTLEVLGGPATYGIDWYAEPDIDFHEEDRR